MNKILTALILLSGLLFSFGSGLAAQENSELVILYTGDTQGHVDPCG